MGRVRRSQLGLHHDGTGQVVTYPNLPGSGVQDHHQGFQDPQPLGVTCLAG
jgi:hypothetical protein